MSFFALALLIGCGNKYVILGGDVDSGLSGWPVDDSASEDTAGEDSAEDTPEVDIYADAVLVVLSPAPGEFLALEEPHTFVAEVRDSSGAVLPFTDITWASSVDRGWFPVGSNVTADALLVGLHTITAQAILPNGDRLSYAIGGVLVQSIYAGTYAGSLKIQASYDAYSAGCSGALALIIDAYGQTMTGSGECALSLQGYELNSLYLLDEVVNSAGTLEGDIGLDVFGFSLPTPFSGTLTEEGEFVGTFSSEVLGLVTTGEVEATRLSRDTVYP